MAEPWRAYRVICLREDGGELVRVIKAESAASAFGIAHAMKDGLVIESCLVCSDAVGSRTESLMLERWGDGTSMHSCVGCGYRTVGLNPDENGLVMCPECGVGSTRHDAGTDVPRSSRGRTLAMWSLVVGVMGFWSSAAVVGGLMMGVLAYEWSSGRRGAVGILINFLLLTAQAFFWASRL